MIYTPYSLCERLRVMISNRDSLSDLPIRFIWEDNECCGGNFSAVFEEVPGITVEEDQGAEGIPISPRHSAWSADFEFRYADIRPRETVRQGVRKNIEMMGDRYIAVFVSSGKKKTPFETFYEYIEMLQDLPIWVVTDCRNALGKFLAEYGSRVFSVTLGDLPENAEFCPLTIEAIELYTSISASSFVGNYNSLFTRFVRQHHNLLSLEERRAICGA